MAATKKKTKKSTTLKRITQDVALQLVSRRDLLDADPDWWDGTDFALDEDGNLWYNDAAEQHGWTWCKWGKDIQFDGLDHKTIVFV